MFLVALIIGGVAGYLVTANVAGAIIGAVGLVMLAFAAQFMIGTRFMRAGGEQVPVDLAGAPDLRTDRLRTGYAVLPLAQRNAIIAREVARSAGREPEAVALILADMMGRNRMSNLITQRAAESVAADVRPFLVDGDRASAICAAEIDFAAQSSMPPNDRVRAIVERNFGRAVDQLTMAQAIMTSRLPRMDATVMGLIDDAISGRRNLALVVGTIRKVGEYHAREVAKIH
jgi:hypothetical protein